MYVIMYLLLLLLIAILIVGLPILISVGSYRLLKRKGHNKMAVALSILTIAVPGYYVFNAIFPDESFYTEEFKVNTDIPLPSSAVFLSKDATYPDIHGSYTSVAVIRLSETDYSKLYEHFKKDKIFQRDTSVNSFLYSSEETLRNEGFSDTHISTVFVGMRKYQFKIAFMSDGRTIFFERHSS
jgi:hypothetical protein